MIQALSAKAKKPKQSKLVKAQQQLLEDPDSDVEDVALAQPAKVQKLRAATPGDSDSSFEAARTRLVDKTPLPTAQQRRRAGSGSDEEEDIEMEAGSPAAASAPPASKTNATKVGSNTATVQMHAPRGSGSGAAASSALEHTSMAIQPLPDKV